METYYFGWSLEYWNKSNLHSSGYYKNMMHNIQHSFIYSFNKYPLSGHSNLNTVDWMHLLATAPFSNSQKTAPFLCPSPQIIYNISITWQWLVKLPINTHLHLFPFLQSFPWVSWQLNTFKTGKNPEQWRKRVNRNKIPAAGQQMVMLVDLLGPRKWETNSAMGKAKGKPVLLQCPKA